MGLIGFSFRWGLLLQALALIHFIRRRPDTFWLWIIIFFGPLGALVYMAIEVVPDLSLLRGSFHGFSRRRRIHELQRIVEENPAVGNREELADLLLEEKQYARARELYDSIITPKSEDLDPVYRRALAELALSDAPAAARDLDRVVSADPKYDFHRASGLLAYAYALSGRVAEADAAFQRALERSSLNETSYHYAEFLAANGRAAEAREWAERILANKSTIPRFLRRQERPWFRKASALLKKTS